MNFWWRLAGQNGPHLSSQRSPEYNAWIGNRSLRPNLTPGLNLEVQLGFFYDMASKMYFTTYPFYSPDILLHMSKRELWSSFDHPLYLTNECFLSESAIQLSYTSHSDVAAANTEDLNRKDCYFWTRGTLKVQLKQRGCCYAGCILWMYELNVPPSAAADGSSTPALPTGAAAAVISFQTCWFCSCRLNKQRRFFFASHILKRLRISPIFRSLLS